MCSGLGLKCLFLKFHKSQFLYNFLSIIKSLTSSGIKYLTLSFLEMARLKIFIKKIKTNILVILKLVTLFLLNLYHSISSH